MKTKPKSVETELLEITSAKPRKAKEDEQDYLARLCKTGNDDIADDDWEKLSADAQGWLNEAARAMKAEKTIPPLPGDDEVADEEEADVAVEEANADEEDAEEEEEKPLKSTLKKTKAAKKGDDEEDPPAEEDEDGDGDDDDEEEDPAKPAKVKASKETEDGEAEEPKGKKGKKAADGDQPPKEKKKRGLTEFLRAAVVDDPDIDRDDLVELATKAGFLPSPRTADIVMESTVKTIEILKKKGLLKAS